MKIDRWITRWALLGRLYLITTRIISADIYPKNVPLQNTFAVKRAHQITTATNVKH